MKNILLPIDLNPNTLNLLKYVEPIASEFKACIILLHVIKKQPYDNGTFSPKTPVHSRVKQEVRYILEKISRKAILKGIRTRILIMDGNPSEVILDAACKTQADMILMSRTNEMERRISVKILSEAKCPVLHWRGSNYEENYQKNLETASINKDFDLPYLIAA